jgi:CubicO group peptidase (beta-lactamase class C family)
MKRLLSGLLLFVYIVPSIVLAQTPALKPSPASAQSEIDAHIKRVEQGLLPSVLIKGDPAFSLEERMKLYKVPGLSIAVIKDFKIEWARAYGVKDVETNEPVTTETLFQAGSISKSVNAMIAMKKVEQGKISLDENINNKLTTWKLPDNELTARKKVTLRNLLSHTAGTTVHGFPGYAVNEKIPTLPQVLDGVAPANTAAVRVDLAPGTQFRYSGGGTTIAQLAIMDIEKKPFPDIARETVLGPLGMTNSTYSQPLPDDWRRKAASGHLPNGETIEGEVHVYPEMAAAGLWTTPSDLAKFAIEMQLSLAGRSNKVLSKATVEMMTTEVMSEVGLGFFLEKHGAATYFGHGGADEGFLSEMLVSRDKGYGVVVMVNSNNGQILREVMRSVAREYGWDEFLPPPYELAAIDSARLNDYQGRFLSNPDRVLTITNQDGKLMALPTAEPPFELLPISATTFIRRDARNKYEFVRGAVKDANEGTATSNSTKSAADSAPFELIRIDLGNGTVEAKRMAADAFVPFELLLSGKIAEAVDGYLKIKKESPSNASLNESRLNNLGYGLMRNKKLAEAIAILKLNTEFYPNSSNVYDSLGEAYMTNGDKELAIANYKKSLELDPSNKNAEDTLKKLTGK